MRLFVDLQIDTIRQQHLDRMRVTQGERGNLAFHVRTVADAHDVELPGEPGRNALHRVCGKRSCKPVQRGMCIRFPMDLENSGVLLNAYAFGNRYFESSLRALHLQLVANLYLHSGRYRDWLFSYSGHELLKRFSVTTRLFTRRGKESRRQRLLCALSGPSSHPAA